MTTGQSYRKGRTREIMLRSVRWPCGQCNEAGGSSFPYLARERLGSQQRDNKRGDRMRRREFTSLMKLAVEANGVVGLRMIKLMRGGRSARREAELMVSEKIHAAFEAAASLMAGASGDEIVHRYRQHVARNAKRLGRLKSGRSRNRVRKRTRRGRK
jgi:hypothetical protein